jgi:hypothetical protein
MKYKKYILLLLVFSGIFIPKPQRISHNIHNGAHNDNDELFNLYSSSLQETGSESKPSNARVVETSDGGIYYIWENNGYIFRKKLKPNGVEDLFIGKGLLSFNINSTLHQSIPTPGTKFFAGGLITTWVRDGNIYAEKINYIGQPQWKDIAVSEADKNQTLPQIVSDGDYGAIIVWQDFRNENWDIYAQKISGDGNIWSIDGIPVSDVSENQCYPQIISDESAENTGAIIVWQDYRNGNWDIYAQKIYGNGSTAWISNGIPVCDATEDQIFPKCSVDGNGGVIITWQDYRNNKWDIYVQKIYANGSTAWISNGMRINRGFSSEYKNALMPNIVSDTNKGAIVAFQYQYSNMLLRDLSELDSGEIEMSYDHYDGWRIFLARINSNGDIKYGNNETGNGAVGAIPSIRGLFSPKTTVYNASLFDLVHIGGGSVILLQYVHYLEGSYQEGQIYEEFLVQRIGKEEGKTLWSYVIGQKVCGIGSFEKSLIDIGIGILLTPFTSGWSIAYSFFGLIPWNCFIKKTIAFQVSYKYAYAPRICLYQDGNQVDYNGIILSYFRKGEDNRENQTNLNLYSRRLTIHGKDYENPISHEKYGERTVEFGWYDEYYEPGQPTDPTPLNETDPPQCPEGQWYDENLRRCIPGYDPIIILGVSLVAIAATFFKFVKKKKIRILKKNGDNR